MPEILAKLPGDSILDACLRLRVSRNTYYCWLRGDRRPNAAKALRLSQITGYSLEDILGYDTLQKADAGVGSAGADASPLPAGARRGGRL